MYYELKSKEIQVLIKEYEGVPHIRYDIKRILDEKEAEFQKRRNATLFQIKTYEKQLGELQQAYSQTQI